MMSSTTSPTMKTAIITGACSGMGLALTQHLLSKYNNAWRVLMADINATSYEKISATLDSDRTKFVRIDVSSWEDNAIMFKTAFHWEGEGTNKIDFFCANAGTGDKEAIAQEFDPDQEPERPNLTCIDVNQTSVFYGLKLFIHYSRKTRRALQGQSALEDFKPKVTIMASCTALYPFPVAPQYVTSKGALLSLTRAVGNWLYDSDGIAVNCVMPAYVATNITYV